VKKVLGIVLLVLAFSLVSAPAFAQQVELDLRLWYPGVVGADEWVADYGTYDLGSPVPTGVSTLQWEPPPHKDENTLILKPGSGLSFILSGEYFILPSISVGASYWGLSRADEVGVILENDIDFYLDTFSSNGNNGSETFNYYWVKVPWVEEELPAFIFPITTAAGEERISMSALDICAAKTFSGSSWQAGLSGGMRRATFNQNLLTNLGVFTDFHEDGYYEGERIEYDLDSKVNVIAIGPEIGIEGTYALADKLALKAGAKAGILFGTAVADAVFTGSYLEYYHEEDSVLNVGIGSEAVRAQIEDIPDDWIVNDDKMQESFSVTDPVQIKTFDLFASLAYQITEQLSIEAGYYASIWKGVPSVLQFRVDESAHPTIAEDDGDPTLWEQPEARDITVRGLTLGVNFKF
jgi:hypothetical protein